MEEKGSKIQSMKEQNARKFLGSVKHLKGIDRK